MSASDNLSTKCSGLLLRSSFAILAARARHLYSAAPMPAFSVASRPSNSSDIMRAPTRWSPVERTRFKVVPAAAGSVPADTHKEQKESPGVPGLSRSHEYGDETSRGRTLDAPIL